jgi:hypothetical protein
LIRLFLRESRKDRGGGGDVLGALAEQKGRQGGCAGDLMPATFDPAEDHRLAGMAAVNGSPSRAWDSWDRAEEAPVASIPRSRSLGRKSLSIIPQTSGLVADGPPEVGREIAMVGAAMYDAVNAATGEAYEPYAYTSGQVLNASVDATALQAGYTVMQSLFTNNPVWNADDSSLPPSVSLQSGANRRDPHWRAGRTDTAGAAHDRAADALG